MIELEKLVSYQQAEKVDSRVSVDIKENFT